MRRVIHFLPFLILEGEEVEVMEPFGLPESLSDKNEQPVDHHHQEEEEEGGEGVQYGLVIT